MFGSWIGFLGGNRLVGYLAVALAVLIVVGGVWLKFKHYQSKIKVLEAQVQTYKTSFETQKLQVQQAKAALRTLQERYDVLSRQFRESQKVCQETIARYKQLLDRCLRKKSRTKIVIKTVESDQCPRIQLKESGDPLLEELQRLF